MAGFGEAVRGNDRATRIMKYDGLPENGKPIVEEYKRSEEFPVIGSFRSTLGDGVLMDNPILAATEFGDSVQKPKFMAKLTLVDSHSDDLF